MSNTKRNKYSTQLSRFNNASRHHYSFSLDTHKKTQWFFPARWHFLWLCPTSVCVSDRKTWIGFNQTLHGFVCTEFRFRKMLNAFNCTFISVYVSVSSCFVFALITFSEHFLSYSKQSTLFHLHSTLDFLLAYPLHITCLIWWVAFHF